MKLAMVITDLAALGVIAGTVLKIIPAITIVLAAVYYVFVVYDRIRYGPEAKWPITVIRERTNADT